MSDLKDRVAKRKKLNNYQREEAARKKRVEERDKFRREVFKELDGLHGQLNKLIARIRKANESWNPKDHRYGEGGKISTTRSLEELIDAAYTIELARLNGLQQRERTR